MAQQASGSSSDGENAGTHTAREGNTVCTVTSTAVALSWCSRPRIRHTHQVPSISWQPCKLVLLLLCTSNLTTLETRLSCQTNMHAATAGTWSTSLDVPTDRALSHKIHSVLDDKDFVAGLIQHQFLSCAVSPRAACSIAIREMLQHT